MAHSTSFLPLKLSSGHVRRFIVLTAVFLSTAYPQTPALTNASVNGTFFFRHLQITTDTTGAITDSRSAVGTIIFDGAGHYSLNSQQTIANQIASNLSGQGTYSIAAAGTMTIGNPLRNFLTINARVGSEAIVGSTTESGDSTYDLFIAIPAATGAQAANVFSGSYLTATLEFPLSLSTYAKSAFFTLIPSSNGLFSLISGTGHALNVNAGQVSSFSLSSTTYALNNDGTATANFGSASNFLTGLKNILVSASGNIILGGSTVAGSQDFLVGVRANSSAASLSNFSGLFYTGGLRLDAMNHAATAYVGSSNALPSIAKVATYQREHFSTLAPFDFTGYHAIALNSDGTYIDAVLNKLGLGTKGGSYVSADLASALDPQGFSIDFGIAAVPLSGSGTYINPQGVVNGASFSPIGGSIAPGEFVTLFGSSLAAADTVAGPPYPLALGGVTVAVNNIPAPVYMVSATQINFLVPYSISNGTATIVVNNNGKESNSVTVPVSATAPGIFTLDATGAGPAAILHSANNTVVNSANPAKRGETVSIFLTGLGQVSPSVPDGTPGLSNPLSVATSTVSVTIGNQSAKVSYSGLAPGYPGLYQINVAVPSNLTTTGSLGLLIQTPNAISEQSTIAIQ